MDCVFVVEAGLGLSAVSMSSLKRPLLSIRTVSSLSLASFLHFVLLFWNHVLTCVSVRQRLEANSALFSSDTYNDSWQIPVPECALVFGKTGVFDLFYVDCIFFEDKALHLEKKKR